MVLRPVYVDHSPVLALAALLVNESLDNLLELSVFLFAFDIPTLLAGTHSDCYRHLVSVIDR